jgi:tripartite ATP-independent transporter DctM subunit
VDYGIALLILVALAFLLILGGVWIFLSLLITGCLGIMVFIGQDPGQIVTKVAFGTTESFTLTCLPLFVLMGEILFRSGVSDRFYNGVAVLLERIPGRLLHTNIFACTIFAAVSGSSAATCATIGTVAVPTLKELGYEKGISLGSLAGAGTLGFLIPPSIVLIIYGSMTAQSIGQLFLAGVLPGAMVSGLFMSYILIRAILNPRLTPGARHYTYRDVFKGLAQIIPTGLLIFCILGLIYLGVTTPTEAGAIGVAGALAVTALYKKMSWNAIREASLGAVRTTCMIMFIIVGASVVSVTLSYLRIPQQLAATVGALGLSKYVMFTIICIIYIGLGCLFDGASMMVLTLPIVFPLIVTLGFHPIWFGITLTILIEVAQITPPVGFNLYILQNISGEKIELIIRNSFPFFLIMLGSVILLILFPEVTLWLPTKML